MMATVLSWSMHLERYIREHTHVYDIGPLQLSRLQQRLHFWLASEATLLIPTHYLAHLLSNISALTLVIKYIALSI